MLQSARTALLGAALLLGVGACGGPAGSAVALPDRFPPDVPVPRAGRLRAAVVSKGQATVIWESERAPADAEREYRERMTQEGWRLVTGLASDQATFLSYRKDGRTAAVSLGPMGRGTSLGVACRLL